MITYFIALLAACGVTLFVLGVAPLALADVFAKSRAFRGVREKLEDMIMDAFDASDGAWKPIFIYGLSCRPCMAFWLAGIQAGLLCPILGVWPLLGLLWGCGYIGARILDPLLPSVH